MNDLRTLPLSAIVLSSTAAQLERLFEVPA
jgi:hypothetical protein